MRGLPLHVRIDGLYQVDPKYPTHIAYLVTEARLLEAVAATSRAYERTIRPDATGNLDDLHNTYREMCDALDALDDYRKAGR